MSSRGVVAARRLRDAGVKAGPQLDAYSACLDYHSNVFRKCRKEQAAFEDAYPLR